MRRYVWVLVAALAGAVLVSALLRMPHQAERSVAAPAQARAVMLGVEVFANRVRATADSIEVGSTVELSVTNRASTPLRVRLTGYEDRVDTGEIEPGGTWRGEFVADRPGEQFAWLVNEQPLGRLDIRGSHLVEGHR